MDSRGMPCARARGAWGVPFEGTQAIVSLQLLTCLRRFQVILKYCRTTQARYFAMTSSREPSRPMTNRLLRSAVNCPSSTEPLNCRRHLVKDTLSVSFTSDEVIWDHVLSGPLHERALAIIEKALGPEHPDTAMGLNNLAGLLRAQSDLARARAAL